MANLIEKLGGGYFFDRYRDKLFVKDGLIMAPAGQTTARSVECRVVAANKSRLVGAQVAVPADFFQSFDTFAFPTAGYVPYKNGAYYTSRTIGRVFSSGFSADSIRWMASAATAYLETIGLAKPAIPTTSDALCAIVFPEYHKPAVLKQVLDGDALCYVPNNRVLVEPTVRVEYDLYDVFLDGMFVGSLTPQGTVSKNTLKANVALIKGLINNE